MNIGADEGSSTTNQVSRSSQPAHLDGSEMIQRPERPTHFDVVTLYKRY